MTMREFFSCFLHMLSFVLTTLCILVSSLAAQDILTLNGRVFEQVSGKWYQLEGGKRYEVNPRVITIKFKPDVDTSRVSAFNLTQQVRVLRDNGIGFIDVEIPIPGDVFNVVKRYLASNLVDIAEVKSLSLCKK